MGQSIHLEAQKDLQICNQSGSIQSQPLLQFNSLPLMMTTYSPQFIHQFLNKPLEIQEFTHQYRVLSTFKTRSLYHLNKHKKQSYQDSQNKIGKCNWRQLINKNVSQQQILLGNLKLNLNILTPQNYIQLKNQIIKLLANNNLTQKFMDMLFSKMASQPKYITVYISLLKELVIQKLQVIVQNRWSALYQRGQNLQRIFVLLANFHNFKLINYFFLIRQLFNLLICFMEFYCNSTQQEIHLECIVIVLEKVSNIRLLNRDQQIGQKLVSKVIESHNSMHSLIRQVHRKYFNQTTLLRILQIVSKNFCISFRIKLLIANLLDKRALSLKSIIDDMEAPSLSKQLPDIQHFLNFKYHNKMVQEVAEQQTRDEADMSLVARNCLEQKDFSLFKLSVIKALDKYQSLQKQFIFQLFKIYYDAKQIQLQTRTAVFIDLIDRNIIHPQICQSALLSLTDQLQYDLPDFPGLRGSLSSLRSELRRQGLMKQVNQFWRVQII